VFYVLLDFADVFIKLRYKEPMIEHRLMSRICLKAKLVVQPCDQANPILAYTIFRPQRTGSANQSGKSPWMSQFLT
jgi:hypothetical protein